MSLSLGVRVVEEECDINHDPNCCHKIPMEKCSKATKINVGADGTPVEVKEDGTSHVLQEAKVNLHDCLSCGYVETSECVSLD